MFGSRIRVVALTVCVALAVAGCASGNDGSTAASAATTPTTSQSSVGTSTSAAPSGQPAVPEILQFTATTVGGGQFDAATLAGRPTVFWFWAAWCPRCRAKAADVKAVQAERSDAVSFVGVAGLGSGDEAMARFVSQYGLGEFPHLADDAGSVWRRFGVTEQEFFVLINATGTVVHKGPLSRDELSQRVTTLAG